MPEPHNNLAVIWAQKGRYDKAKTELEIALAAHPDYAIAHENLGDVYSRLAGAEYDRALALDKTNKSAQTKLTLVRELYAVAPSSNAPLPGSRRRYADPPPKPSRPRDRFQTARPHSTEQGALFSRISILFAPRHPGRRHARAAANPQVGSTRLRRSASSSTRRRAQNG